MMRHYSNHLFALCALLAVNTVALVNSLPLNVMPESQNGIVVFDEDGNPKDEVTIVALNQTRAGCCVPCKVPPTGKAGNSNCCDVITSVFFTPISSHDIANPNGLTISNSGIYYLSGSINVTPASSGCVSFITIDADNVTLNLNSQVIGQDAASTAPNNIGIHIAAGRKNITLMNGRLANIRGTGIKIEPGAGGIELRKMEVVGMDVYGILSAGTQIAPINGLTLTDVVVGGNTGVGSAAATGTCAGSAIPNEGAIGLRTQYTNNITLEHSEFDGNGILAAVYNGTGAFISNTCNAQIVNSSASNNQGANATGFHIDASRSVKFLGDTASCNTASAGNAIGINVTNSESIYFGSTTTQSNISNAGNTTDGGEGIGIQLLNSCCSSFDGTLSSSNEAHGPTIFVGPDCCNGGIITPTSAAYGYKFVNSDGNGLCCAKALCNRSTSSTGYGFYFNNCRNNNVEGSVSQNNSGLGVGGEAYGYFSFGGTGNRFNSSIALGNTGGTGTCIGGRAAGFMLCGGERGTCISYSEATNNGSVGGEGYGIKLGFPDDVNQIYITIEQNRLNSNLGGFKSYGFKDFGTHLSAHLTRNTSYGHGRVFPLAPGNVIVDNGAKNYQFTLCGPQFSPANMITEADTNTLTTLDTTGPAHNVSLYIPC